MGYKRLPPLNMPDDPATLGYIAGIIDGEGYIGISSAFCARSSKKVSHYVRVVVTNTDPRLINWFVERFDGVVSVSRGRKKGWKPRYSWQINGSRAERFLEKIRPHLVIKGEQADIAIQFRRLLRWKGGGDGKGSKPIPNEIVQKREELKQRLHVLNARGTGTQGRKAHVYISP